MANGILQVVDHGVCIVVVQSISLLHQVQLRL